jgi:hypothetical protein
MSQQQQKTQKESSFDLVKVAAGAVGAMASAVLLSTLGAAGTITGAALGSVIVTVAGSMFSKGVDVSKQGVSAAQALAARRVAQARSQVGRASQDMDDSPQAQQRLSAANAELDAAESELHAEEAPAEEAGTAWQERLAVLPWKRIALAAAAVFLVAMAVITGFELLSGRAVSSMTGGSSDQERTSFSGLTDRDKPTPSPTPTPTPTESSSPSESPSLEESPSVEPTETPSESASPSEDTSSTPTEEPTASDTAAPEETASPTP